MKKYLHNGGNTENICWEIATLIVMGCGYEMKLYKAPSKQGLILFLWQLVYVCLAFGLLSFSHLVFAYLQRGPPE